ncbi:hypothetical protein [Kitasatospora cathayae]|uniref:Uncharacterized protein n=1 Tax=Kitasatospora cathayae TaxID=3004092 RepID=A0ABY7QEE6_9ACTN|nr:hypothetical protein [Kitasatospora sp. HUAS 3-15]WBP90997.1 hypothetical protein O1G21_37435 [Kitasatospora sp. HUAS 3-15]
MLGYNHCKKTCIEGDPVMTTTDSPDALSTALPDVREQRPFGYLG